MPSKVALSLADSGVFGELDPPANVVAVPTIPGGNAGMVTLEAEVGVPLLLLFIDVVLLWGGGVTPIPRPLDFDNDDVLPCIAGLAVFMTLARSSYAVSLRKVKEGTEADVGVAKEEGAAPAYPMTDALLGVDCVLLLLAARDCRCPSDDDDDDEGEEADDPAAAPTTAALELRRCR